MLVYGIRGSEWIMSKILDGEILLDDKELREELERRWNFIKNQYTDEQKKIDLEKLNELRKNPSFFLIKNFKI